MEGLLEVVVVDLEVPFVVLAEEGGLVVVLVEEPLKDGVGTQVHAVAVVEELDFLLEL